VRIISLSALLLLCCAAPDPHRYLSTELAFLQTGVHLEAEEKEVRRVLAQRGLRVGARFQGQGFIALGAASRDHRLSAVRVITGRGVVVAEDAALDDLFEPARVALLEHFGGQLGDYTFVATSRVLRGYDAGCVTLRRLLPDGSVVQAELDVSALGSRACVSNLAPAKLTRVRAKVAWPSLHVLTTPQLDVELSFVQAPLGQATPVVPVAKIAETGDWLEAERNRLTTLRLAQASFSERHSAGVARAALALLAGQETALQAAAYRNAVARVPPGSLEAETVGETVAHIERGWLDPTPPPAEADAGASTQPGQTSPDPPLEEGAIVVEPEAP
jgi:hypothetical protein